MPAPLLLLVAPPPQIRSITALYVRRPQEVVRCHVIHLALKFVLFVMKHLLRTDPSPDAPGKGLGGTALAGKR